jgi:tetratricopeptide (TPR) repeat protein
MGKKPSADMTNVDGSRSHAAAEKTSTTAERPPRRSWRWNTALSAIAVLSLSVLAAGLYYAYAEYRLSRIARAVRQEFAARNINAAREPLRRWLELRPQSGEAHYYHGWQALADDQPHVAVEAIKQAQALNFDPALMTGLSAIWEARSGRFKEAEPILARAYHAQTEPRDMIARELARIYLSTYRFDQADGPLERWRSLAPADPQPYLWRNEILARAGAEPQLLVQNYRAALERDVNLDKARLGLAQQLSKARQLDESEQEYRAYLERKPNDPVALLGLGRNAFQQGDIDSARRHFEAALKSDPRQVEALKELGQIDLRLGRYQQACESLKQLTRIDPFDTEVRYTYAQALKLAGDLTQAKAELANAARLRKDNDEIIRLRDIVRKDPSNLAARFQVARWMFDHGQDDEGLNWTKEILRADPGHVPTHTFLVEYYTRTGQAGLANFHRVMATAGHNQAP